MFAHLTPCTHRRYLRIGASLGVAIALASGPMLLAPAAARADDGDPVLAGRNNHAVTVTTISNDAANGTAIVGYGNGSGTGVEGVTDSGLAVYGFSSAGGTGVAGSSRSGRGVWGASGSYIGVYGQSDSYIGVYGFTDSGNGVHGQSRSGNGIVGLSNGPEASGVYGFNSSAGYGVAGRTGSTERAGTLGDNTGSGPGVLGESAAGTGVQGISHGAAVAGVSGDATASDGVGVRATASGSGTALSVTGKMKFSRSGTITIPAGASSITKSGVTLNTGSFVLATLQAYRAGVAVAAVVPDPVADSFTVYLTRAVTASTKVAWFIVN